MFENAIIDEKVISFFYLLLIIFITSTLFLKILLPWLKKTSKHDNFTSVRSRMFLVLAELSDDKRKEEYNTLIEETEDDFYKKMGFFVKTIPIYLTIEAIIVTFEINHVISQVLRYTSLTLLVLSFIYALTTLSLISYHEKVWINILSEDYPILHFSFKDKIYSRTTHTTYQVVRKYVQEQNAANFSTLFNEKLANTIKLSSRYNKTVKSIEETIDKFQLEHLWYDNTLIFGNKHERYRKILSFILISSTLLFIGSITKVALIDDYSGFPKLYWIFFISNLIIIGFGSALYQFWFVTPRLNKAQIIDFLDNHNISYSPGKSYFIMREYMDGKLNTSFNL